MLVDDRNARKVSLQLLLELFTPTLAGFVWTVLGSNVQIVAVPARLPCCRLRELQFHYCGGEGCKEVLWPALINSPPRPPPRLTDPILPGWDVKKAHNRVSTHFPAWKSWKLYRSKDSKKRVTRFTLACVKASFIQFWFHLIFVWVFQNT